ncbi:MAG: response regulator transcription factor [Clostridia bacterium]|nr:MAG: response regulator transcription factor [Clostridia bacterium]
MEKVKVMVVDDHQMVRLGLIYMLRDRAGFEAVGEARTAPEAVELAKVTHPDVALVDIRLPGSSGVEACEQIRRVSPQTKVIMLTSYPDPEALLSSIRAGASGYFLKDVEAEELVAAILKVSRGESVLDSKVTGHVLERLQLQAEAETLRVDGLTVQEERILALIAQGKTNKQIAEELFLSPRTVKNYVSSILEKINARNRVEAAAYVLRRLPPKSL